MQDTTVLISSSPIESHPSTEIILETIASVRKHFPTAPIWILQDGVREEQMDRIDHYVEYLHRLAAHCVLKETDITLMPFPEFLHQGLMTQRVMDLVKSPFVLYLEHDTPILDRPIDWRMLKEVLTDADANHIRLHYDETIHPEHVELMRGKLTDNLIKTIQYHNRPFLTNAGWFRGILRLAIKETSRCHIEDIVYTFVAHSPWEAHRCCVYDPEGTGQNMKRSGHTDGRRGENKFDEVF